MSENIEFGTDEEKALTKAIGHVLPSATRVLCSKHLKDNVKHYLQNNVGMGKVFHYRVMNKIFSEDGITDANCTEILNVGQRNCNIPWRADTLDSKITLKTIERQA